MAQCGIVEPGDVVTGRDLLIVQRDAPADVVRDELVVAGENLYRHAVALEFRQHLGDIRQNRVGEADKSGQDQTGLIVARVRVARLQPAVGDRQNSQAVRAQLLVNGVTGASGRRVERRHPSLGFERRGQADDRFGCALGNEEPATAFWRLDDDRQTPALEIERNFIDLPVALDVGCGLEKNRGIKRTADTRLEPTVDIRERHRSRRGRATRIDGPFELHDTSSERPGLVGAQNIDAAEILNRRKVFDDHLVPRHPERALRQRDGTDHRQELWGETDAQRHGEEQRLERVVLERDAHQQDEQDQHDRRPKDEQTEPMQSVFELCFRSAGPQSHGDVAEHRLRPRRDGPRSSRAADDRCAQKHQLRSVRARRAVVVGGGDHLVGRQGFAGQHRLLNREVS